MTSYAAVGAESPQVVSMTPRRRAPWLLVEVDGSPEAQRALVWALREAARREAVVVAVGVLPCADRDPAQPTRLPATALDTAHEQLDAALCRAIAETGVHGRSRTAVLERPVFDALSAATHGSDLVVVGADGKRLLRPALPRPSHRRIARGA
ncbi:universal stress protein [Blastococcus sp. CCUG 61487]|uniref:universal stress protein n=1 Tax=Blastococcus sp. CCUG 61487 TaxID=1840703 RepID=UPI0011337712|nr:universal stress protein [Blastococcus sp. CCUG 61487]TKJ28534.1 hypothetical protein A6V29_00445 [Blastococcus sp. CCUG 61487]